MGERRLRKWALIILCFCLYAPQAETADLPALSDVELILLVDGKRVNLPFRVNLHPGMFEERVEFDMKGNLGPLVESLERMLYQSRRFQSCGDRVNFDDVRIGRSEASLVVSATVRYEKWHCIRMKVPRFSGLNVEFEDKVVEKVMLIDTESSFTVRWRLSVDPKASRVVVSTRATEPGGFIKEISGVVGVYQQLTVTLAKQLEHVLNRGLVGDFFPRDLAPYELELREAAFSGQTGAELQVEVAGQLKGERDLQERLRSLKGR